MPLCRAAAAGNLPPRQGSNGESARPSPIGLDRRFKKAIPTFIFVVCLLFSLNGLYLFFGHGTHVRRIKLPCPLYPTETTLDYSTSLCTACWVSTGLPSRLGQLLISAFAVPVV